MWKSKDLEIIWVVLAVNELEQQAFIFCEKDGEPGLTWNEVEECEVSIHFQTWGINFNSIKIN